MCGRYLLNVNQDLVGHYHLDPQIPLLNTTLTAVPGGKFPIIINHEGRNQLQLFNWGIGQNLFNARAETVMAKPTFRYAYNHNRCLVPATGFFEWQHTPNHQKIPYYFSKKDSSIFSFAGIFAGDTYSIITTTANSIVEPVHPRMPLILSPQSESLWLSQTPINILDLQLTSPLVSLKWIHKNH